MVDRRSSRTRSALERSFNEIFLAQGYEKTTPARVAEAAEVGRSTFYEHFDGREDLFEQSLAQILRPLAATVGADAVPPDLEPVLDHFWTSRVIVRPLLAGRPRTVTMRALTALIEAELTARKSRPAIALRLVSTQIAGAQLGMIEEWLSGRHRCSNADLAHALAASSRAIALIHYPQP